MVIVGGDRVQVRDGLHDNAPGHVALDGTPLYTPDGKAHYAALWTRDFASMVENAGDYIPLSPNGLVWNDPEKPHSPYGFTDTVAKTGELFMESLLYWRASKMLA